MATSLRSLEITVLSAENLRKDGKSIKKNTFAVVKIDPFNRHSTKIDTEGGSYPSWNDQLLIELPMHESFVTLEVHRKSRNNNSRIIGTARMPISDIFGEFYTPLDYLRFLSYRLRDEKGERNGIINVSVRAKAPEYNHTSSKTTSLSLGGYTNHGLVTGVPVRCGFRA